MSTPVGLSTASCPLGKAEYTFRLAAELGYDGVEVMVWSERSTQDQAPRRWIPVEYG
ncbi:Xylose isomerase protein, partial [human gut metagenome]